jgi:hypothetical protein
MQALKLGFLLIGEGGGGVGFVRLGPDRVWSHADVRQVHDAADQLIALLALGGHSTVHQPLPPVEKPEEKDEKSGENTRLCRHARKSSMDKF